MFNSPCGISTTDSIQEQEECLGQGTKACVSRIRTMDNDDSDSDEELNEDQASELEEFGYYTCTKDLKAMALTIEDYRVQDDRYRLYDVYFYSDRILTTVTSDPDIVTDWINEIEFLHRRRLNRLIVGLDIEWRPSFNRYQQNPVATSSSASAAGASSFNYLLRIHTRCLNGVSVESLLCFRRRGNSRTMLRNWRSDYEGILWRMLLI
ncbi:hypothetical protein HAX54_025642 [Datura stramonium]|uniref:Uncharacterized protein n=1 Tax=Datura stramonium TaxID=4076 RepID=A0ABS8V1Z5_DATST|nr:hypothetical protein [Datura stramonium]